MTNARKWREKQICNIWCISREKPNFYIELSQNDSWLISSPDQKGQHFDIIREAHFLKLILTGFGKGAKKCSRSASHCLRANYNFSDLRRLFGKVVCKSFEIISPPHFLLCLSESGGKTSGSDPLKNWWDFSKVIKVFRHSVDNLWTRQSANLTREWEIRSR